MLLQVDTVRNCIKLFFCVYLWAGHQAAAESQLIYHNIGEKILIKRFLPKSFIDDLSPF